MERTSRRINELEQINNNTKLLVEMLEHYSPETSSKADLDMMKVRVIDKYIKLKLLYRVHVLPFKGYYALLLQDET